MLSTVLLAATVLCVADLGLLREATAGVQLRSGVRGPYVSIRLDTRPTQLHRPFVYRVKARDRAIARRLSLRTGHHRGFLLDLRARGLTWFQIGRRLGISPRVVRSVIHPHGNRGHHRVRIAGHIVPRGRCGRGR
jgi:hypothetical protein